MNGSIHRKTTTGKEIAMKTMMRAVGAAGLGAALVMGTSLGAAAQQELGGYTWEALGPVTERTSTEVDGIAVLADGTIGMLGRQCEPDQPCDLERAIRLGWSSTDGGATWAEAEVDLPWTANAGMVALGDRFLAPVDGKILSSSDALSWKVVADLDNGEASSIIVTDDGVVIAGNQNLPAEGWGDELGPHPTLWLTADGVEWETHTVSPPILGPDEGFAGLSTAARSDDGMWLLVGNGFVAPEFDQFAFALYGSPETGWTEVPMPDDAVSASGWSTDAGFVTSIEFPDYSTGLWLTTDGTDMQQIVDTNGLQSIGNSGASIAGGFVGFKDPIHLPDGHLTDVEDAVELDGAPAYISPDGVTWTDGELLLGMSATEVTAAPDGSVLVAGGPAPCTAELGDCNYFWTSDNEFPIVMRGTPS
jgi:hypothetical protein